MILGVDTSLPLMSVALLGAEGVAGAIVLEGRESRNEKLLPAIDWLLREAGRNRSDLTILAVTRGPGSFTGVRVALATVQGLGLALGIPLCGFSTHAAAAHAAPASRVIVHSDAGRGERYVAGYERGTELIAPQLMTLAELAGAQAGYDEVIDLGSFAAVRNVAQLAASLALTLRDAGRLAEAADLTPVYVRPSEAEVKLAERTP